MVKRIIISIKNHPIVWFFGFFAASVIPGLTLFDVPIPKPAWSTDIFRLETQQVSAHIQLVEDQLERARLRRLEILREQDQIKRSNETVPDFYLQEQSTIENRINKLEAELEAARDRKIQLSK